MKWLLVVMVMNTPLKTDLAFESLDACLAAEGKMRSEWTAVYNRAVAAKMQPDSLQMMKGQTTHGTCIPSK